MRKILSHYEEKRAQPMAQIINQTSNTVNTVRHLAGLHITEADNHKILGFAASHKHNLKKAALSGRHLKREILNLLDELINHSNSEGDTRISYKSLAALLTCSIKTIERRLAILLREGLISKKKNGWRKTNTISLLFIKTKLNHKEDNLTCDLKSFSNLKDRSTNHYHYEEYSEFDNLHKKGSKVSNSRGLNPLNKGELENPRAKYPNSPPVSPLIIPNHPEIPDSSKLTMKSEWSASRETLPQEVYVVVETKIPAKHRKEAILTLKRLNITDEEKLTLITKVGKIAKPEEIRSIGAVLVSTYRKMGEIMRASTERQRDYSDELRKRHEADEMAKQRLRNAGITDPRLKGADASYDEIREYDSRLAGMVNTCLRELYKPANQQSHFEPRQTWADRAYS